MDNVLVIAFDGLDSQLVDKFDLDNIDQRESGKIDNSTSMSSIKTSELFASFITGVTWKEHGVKGIDRYESDFKASMLDLIPNYAVNNIRGFSRLKNILEALLGAERRRHTKEDLDAKSLFEEVNDSRAISVPTYNPSWPWRMVLARPMRMGGGKEDAEEFCEIDHVWRKKELDQALSYGYAYSLCMSHFHKVDLWQHLYGYPIRDNNKLREVYDEVDDFAGNIKSRAKDVGYDYVIFMSDHGLPTEEGHNENAFYSCNKELFDDETPHITDFHDKILELVGGEIDES